MSDMDDIKELKSVMETLNETVPSLISGIIEAVYNVENSENLAKNTAKFYKELVEAGMDKDQAYQLTRDFMKSRDVTSLVREALSGMGGSFGGGDMDVDIGDDLGERIKEKIMKKMDKGDWE